MSVQVAFDQNIVFRDDASAFCDLFRNSAALFGRGATCRVSRQTLTDEGGHSFSLAPGDTVTTVASILFGSAQVANSLTSSSDSVSGDVAVLAPVRTQLPNVGFISPSSVGPCDDLELRIEDPTPRARYTWICLNDAGVTAAAKGRSIDTRTTKFRSTDLPRVNFGVFDYQFVISSTSLFSQSANSSVFEVFKVSQAVPNVISSKQSSLITEPIIVTAQVEFSACPVKAASMVFEWTTSAADASLGQLLSRFSSSTVMIPERTLVAGRTYTISCSVFKSDEPSKKSVGTYTVETLASPLVASVIGGGRVASVQSELLIDASASFDPDFSGPGIDNALQFLWQCSMVQGDLRVACRDVNGLLLNLTSGRALRFPPDFLIAGTGYEFSVSVFKSGRSAFATAAVQIATGAFVEDATLVLVSQTRVNFNEKVSIVCKSATVITSYDWFISEIGAAAPLRFTNSDPTGQSLLLGPGTLSPGKDYDVTAIVTAKNRQPTKLSMSLSVNSPPSSGSCSVSPSEGIASVTAFAISCDGWVDVDGGIVYEVMIPDGSGSSSRYPLDMGKSMFFPSAGSSSMLNISIVISDKFASETRVELSVRLTLPPPLPVDEVGSSCKKLAQLGKHSEYAQCVDSSFAVQRVATSSNSSRARNLLQTANQASHNITLMKAAVLQKVASAADQAPLGVDALSRSYLQTITPLCSGGDLGQLPSSLSACASLLLRTSQTLLGKPVASEESANVVTAAAGIMASFAVNSTQFPKTSSTVNDALLQVQKMLNVTIAAVYNSAKQAYLGDRPLSFATPFSRHVASRTTLASLNGTVSSPGMASISLAPNFAAQILGSESSGFTQPINVITESYNSSVRWASINKSFVSGVHGLSFYTDAGPIVVSNLPSNCSINISIPLDSNALSSQQATVSNYRCNYWDPVNLGWKQDGCRVISMTQTHVIVSTSHLTQFGIEFQPSPPTPTTTAAPPAQTAPPPPAVPVPSVVLNPPFSRLGSVIVVVSTSSAIFDGSITVCRIVFADLSSIASNTTFDSSTSVKCLVPASVVGRTVNISVTGLVNISVPFSQFESFVFTAVQWDSSLDTFIITSNSTLPSVPQFPCSQLFAVNSTALLGASPACSMGNRSIVVAVGSGCRLRIQQQLILEPSVRIFKTDVPSEIHVTTLPAMTVSLSVPSPTAAVEGSTSFGSCSAISVKLIVYTAAKVARAPELMPSFTWRFTSFQLLANTAYSNVSSVGIAVNQRLAGVNVSQFIFPSGSWQGYNLPSSNLPPGEYKVRYFATTWYGGSVESNVTFSVANEDAPVMSPLRIPDTVYRRQISQFTASVAFSTCSDGNTPTYLWRVRNSANQLIFSSSKKTLSVPQYTFVLTNNNTHFLELVVNGLYRVSSSFELARLPPVVIISSGERITIGSSGGRISADASYDPNFGPNEQPVLAFSWNCSGLDMTSIPSTLKFINIPAITSQIACTVTVASTGASTVSRSASVLVVPVVGIPPSLTISSSLPRVASTQNLALNVRVGPGIESQYRFEWFSSKYLTASDALTSLQASSLVVKGAFFVDATSAIKFTCRVTNILTNVAAETAVYVAVNMPPVCSAAVVTVTSEECVGNVGVVCPVTAMQTKLQIQLSDASGSIASCNDEDGPIKYRLLSFTTSCSTSAKGQVLSSSVVPSFSSINVANGVKSLGIEAIDSLGAVVRRCSPDFSVNAASASALAGVFQGASSGLAGDAEAQKRLVSNIAGSLLSLYTAANGNTAELDSVKKQALAFLSTSSSTAVTDAADAIQAASSLNALVALPGSLSSAQTASAFSMFDQFSASSFALLASGAATIDFATEVGPILVGGSLNVLGQTVSSSSSRRILAYASGMDAAYAAIFAASRVQSFALAASQDAVVTEQPPSLVMGVRRMRSLTSLTSILSTRASLGVAVSVSPDADASNIVDVAIAVVVQATSPFRDSSSTILISPVVLINCFNAATGSAIAAVRNVIEAKFFIDQNSHNARVVANATGSRKGEGCVIDVIDMLILLSQLNFKCSYSAFRCVAFDGTRWSQQCTVGAYSSSNNYMTCTCNATASILAIAAAEFIIDCSGTLGGSLVLDACKTCGGSISDASKCSDNAAASNNGAIIGGAVGGCVALVIIVFGIWHKRRRGTTVSPTSIIASPVDQIARERIDESNDSTLAYVKEKASLAPVPPIDSTASSPPSRPRYLPAALRKPAAPHIDQQPENNSSSKDFDRLSPFSPQ